MAVIIIHQVKIVFMKPGSNNSNLATGLTNDQLSAPEKTATTPVGREDSGIAEQQTTVDTANPGKGVNVGSDNNTDTTAGGIDENDGEDQDSSEDELEEKDFEVDENGDDVTGEDA